MAFLKDKKISFLKFGTGIGSDGWPTQDWIPVKGLQNVWAYYRQASANEFFNSAAVQYKVEAVFKVSWNKDINPNMQILFRGQKYGITRVDDFEGYKHDLTIYAHTINE